MDLIRVNDLLLTVLLHSGSRWPPKGPKPKPTAQPILVSLAIPHDITGAAEADDLTKSINYSTLASTLRTFLSPNVSNEPSFESLEQILLKALDLLLLPESPRLSSAHIKIVQLKPPLHCKAVTVEGEATRGTGSAWSLTQAHRYIENLECQTIVGVNPAERLERQLVRINVSIEMALKHWLDFRALTRRLHQRVEETSYLTLEALASFIAVETLRQLRGTSSEADYDPKVTVKAAKPYALVFADSSEIEICRRFEDYPTTLSLPVQEPLSQTAFTGIHSVVIALGSNIGDTFQNIELALRLLEAPLEVVKDRSIIPQDASLSVVNTSFLYESSPMYVVDQPSFINCACLIETNIRPTSLLQLVKKIEEIIGRQSSFRNGPRAIDLDIVIYDELVIDTRPVEERHTLDNLKGHLVIPHPRMAEREFVLRPLFDMMPDYVHPSLHKDIDTLLKELLLVSDDPPMDRVIPFPRYPLPEKASSLVPGVDPVSPTLTYWKYNDPKISGNRFTRKVPPKRKDRTHLMATLNATPDSFSDGSAHDTIPTALAYVREAARASADIMDIGGYSTRPGAAFVSAEEETNRVVPIIEAIRSEAGNGSGTTSEGDMRKKRAIGEMPISVDTFRPEVAEKAILAGANCINDVYALTGPDSYPYPAGSDAGERKERAAGYMREMKRVARKLTVPVVLMHSRGDAGMNKDYSAYAYGESRDGSVLEGVRIELGIKVDEIVKGKGGIRRWNVVVDPGIGFSKTVEDNLVLLRRGADITADVAVGQVPNRRRNPLAGFPQLIGTSRKSFLGVILSKERGKVTEGKDRTWATAAAVSCAVQQGALVARVHDLSEMSDVISVANALWR